MRAIFDRCILKLYGIKYPGIDKTIYKDEQS